MFVQVAAISESRLRDGARGAALPAAFVPTAQILSRTGE